MIYYDKDSYYGVTGTKPTLNEANGDAEHIGIDFFEQNLDKISIAKSLTANGFLGVLKLFEGKAKKRFQKCARLLRDMQRAFVSNKRGITSISTTGGVIGRFFENIKSSIFQRKSDIGLIPFVESYKKEIIEDYNQTYKIYERTRKSDNPEDVKKDFGTIINVFSEKYISIKALTGNAATTVVDITPDVAQTAIETQKRYNSDVKAQSPKMYERIQKQFANNILARYTRIGENIISNCTNSAQKVASSEKDKQNIFKMKEDLSASWNKQVDFFNSNFIYVMMSILDSEEYSEFYKFIVETCISGYADPQKFIDNVDKPDMHEPFDDSDDADSDTDSDNDSDTDSSNAASSNINQTSEPDSSDNEENPDRWASAFVYAGEDNDVYAVSMGANEALHRSDSKDEKQDVLNEEGEDEKKEKSIFTCKYDKKNKKFLEIGKILVKNMSDEEINGVLGNVGFEKEDLDKDMSDALNNAAEKSEQTAIAENPGEFEQEIKEIIKDETKSGDNPEDKKGDETEDNGDENNDDKEKGDETEDNDDKEKGDETEDNGDEKNGDETEEKGDETEENDDKENGDNPENNPENDVEQKKEELTPDEESAIKDLEGIVFKDMDDDEGKRVVKRGFIRGLVHKIYNNLKDMMSKPPTKKDIVSAVGDPSELGDDVNAVADAKEKGDNEEYTNRLQILKAKSNKFFDKQIEKAKQRQEELKNGGDIITIEEAAEQITKFYDAINNMDPTEFKNNLHGFNYDFNYSGSKGTPYRFVYSPGNKEQSYLKMEETSKLNPYPQEQGTNSNSANDVSTNNTNVNDASTDESLNEGKFTDGMKATIFNVCDAIRTKKGEFGKKAWELFFSGKRSNNLSLYNYQGENKLGGPAPNGIYYVPTGGKAVGKDGKEHDIFFYVMYYIGDGKSQISPNDWLSCVISMERCVVQLTKMRSNVSQDDNHEFAARYNAYDVHRNDIKSTLEMLKANFVKEFRVTRDAISPSHDESNSTTTEESFRVLFSKNKSVSESNNNTVTYTKSVFTDLKTPYKYYMLSTRRFDDGSSMNPKSDINNELKNMFRYKHTLSEISEAVRANNNMSISKFEKNITYTVKAPYNAMTKGCALYESTVLIRFNDEDGKVERVINCGISKYAE